jgi:hypothetical protein
MEAEVEGMVEAELEEVEEVQGMIEAEEEEEGGNDGGGGGGVGRIEGIRKRKLKESCHWLAETRKSFRSSSDQPLVYPSHKPASRTKHKQA